MSTLTQLLGGIGNAFYTPKLNAYGMKNGVPVDKDGNPTSLFVNPGGFERAFNPIAQGIQQENANASSSDLLSQQQQYEEQQGIIGRAKAGEQGNLAAGDEYGAAVKSNPSQALWQNILGYTPYRGEAAQTQANIDSNIPQSNAAHQGLLNDIVGLESGGPFTLQRDASGNYTQAKNPLSVMGAYAGGGTTGTTSSGKSFNRPFSYNPDNPPSTVGSTSGDTGQNQPVPIAPPSIHPQTDADTRSLLGTIGHGLMSPITPSIHAYNYLHNAPLSGHDFSQILTGSSGALPPTEQEIMTQRQAMGMPPSEPQGLTQLPGAADGYKVDVDGNIYYKGHYVPEETIKNTSVGDLRTKFLSMHKQLQRQQAENNLPHNR